MGLLEPYLFATVVVCFFEILVLEAEIVRLKKIADYNKQSFKEVCASHVKLASKLRNRK